MKRATSTLSARLERNLVAYAAVASAAGVTILTLSTPAEARVIYTAVDVVIGYGGVSHYDIDFNHDGVTDIPTTRSWPVREALVWAISL